MLSIRHDARYAARSLLRSPGFTTVAVLTLALAIGTTTAVFSLITSVLLRPLPYDQPDRLVMVWESAPFFGLQDSPVSPANYVDWKNRARSFEEMGAIESSGYRLRGEGAPDMVRGSVVTASLFRALRIGPALGRVFREDEDRSGAPKVAVISDSLWRRRFGADRRVIGSTVVLNEETHTIIGVLAPGTEPPSPFGAALAEIWTPLGSAYRPEQWTERGRHNWMVIARLRDGVPLRQADTEMKAIGASLAREFPETNEKVGAFVAPLREHFVRSSRPVFWVLAGAAAFILLIGCANLANLMLSRGADRSKEAAVRMALGAGGWQLARQFLCESLLLCLLGGALGLYAATGTFEFLAHLAPGDMAGFKTLTVDWRVLAFTTAIALVIAAAFGVMPVLQLRRLEVSRSLKQSARTLAAASTSRRVRSALICSEVALAFMLVTGAGLLLRTFAGMREVEPGFRSQDVLTLSVPPSQVHSGAKQSAAYQREILRRITAIPGVASAGFTNHIPVAFKGDISGVGAEGHDPKERFQSNARVAGPGYIATMGIPLLRGRDLDGRDTGGTPLVALINETLARTLWPGQDPVGRHLLMGTNFQVTVVGLVGDIHQSGLNMPPAPEFYISALQAPFPPASLAIRTRVDPASLGPAVRQAIWAVDPDQPIIDMATMEEILDREVFPQRLRAILLGVFAGLALMLAAIGLYGVLAYLVGRQVPEIGLRMALGAEPTVVLRRVAGRALGLTIVGLCIGLAGAVAVSRLIANLLFGVRPTDPPTYALSAAVLLLTAAAASYLPVRRAVRVDPIVALREE